MPRKRHYILVEIVSRTEQNTDWIVDKIAGAVMNIDTAGVDFGYIKSLHRVLGQLKTLTNKELT